jgi:hypothetical protein
MLGIAALLIMRVWDFTRRLKTSSRGGAKDEATGRAFTYFVHTPA